MSQNNDIFSNLYKPDVLSCLADLSNDEVFTPPKVANQMLDMLPQELFRDPNTKFLDPACKSGIFLREIAKRLIAGLADKIPNLQERCDWIFNNQLYGIAITELTSLLSRRSLYCSKYPNSMFSITKFDNVEGNIKYHKIKHTWRNKKCIYCGTSEKGTLNEVFRDGLETHAYEWIHTIKPEEIFNMKFDVIISNPPYQLSTGGSKAQATPIYNLFVDQAKKLNPRFMAMIMPSRWFSGGFALDSFRDRMINDKHIRVINDFIDSTDCFGNSVQIKGGVCYFLWDRDNEGLCNVVTHDGTNTVKSERYLKEDGCNVFIRYAQLVSIYRKIKSFNERSFDILISGTKPFGFGTTYKGSKYKDEKNNIELVGRNEISYVAKEDVNRYQHFIGKYKVFISGAYGAGEGFPHQIITKPILGGIQSCCTETYIVIGPFDTEREAQNVITYLKTKFVRALIMIKKASQHTLRIVYEYVPMQDFSIEWNDEKLYQKYNLTSDEIHFIESMVKNME